MSSSVFHWLHFMGSSPAEATDYNPGLPLETPLLVLALWWEVLNSRWVPPSSQGSHVRLVIVSSISWLTLCRVAELVIFNTSVRFLSFLNPSLYPSCDLNKRPLVWNSSPWFFHSSFLSSLGDWKLPKSSLHSFEWPDIRSINLNSPIKFCDFFSFTFVNLTGDYASMVFFSLWNKS